MERLPKDHEAYVKFDKDRDFSYIRKYEAAKTAYDQFVAVSVEDYIKSYAAYGAICRARHDRGVGYVAQVEFITPDGHQSAIVLFNEKPTYVKAILTIRRRSKTMIRWAMLRSMRPSNRAFVRVCR